MPKFYAALAACLLLCALSHPVAATTGEPIGSPPKVAGGDNSGGAESGGDHLSPQQSKFDGGIRQVANQTPYCQPVLDPEAATSVRDQEATMRASERSGLTSGLEDSGRDPLVGKVPNRRLPTQPAATRLEFPRTWLSSQVVQQVLKEISSLVDATDGLYGYEIDESAETIVVVHRQGVDLTTAQIAARQLLTSAEDAIATDNSQVAASDLSDLSIEDQIAIKKDMVRLNAMTLANVDITVEFRAVCREEAGDLEATQESIESFDWADDSVPAEFDMAVQRNLADGVIEVVLEADGPDSDRIERRLKEEFGGDVKLVVDPEHFVFGDEQVTSKTSVAGRTFQAGRYADKSPHLGGVQVGDWRFRRGACTTGFAINMPGGGRAMLTAGHCKEFLPLNTYLYSGVFNRGESHNYYGVFYESYWTNQDVGLIGSGSQTYRRKIYTDPDPSGAKERLVTSVWEPWVNAEVCMSGSFTGNVCGGKILSRSTACIRGGPVSQCGRKYEVKHPDGKTLSQPGDSGGPVYLPHGSTSARALGIISTKLGDATSFIGSQAINKATGGWIASSCCDADTW